MHLLQRAGIQFSEKLLVYSGMTVKAVFKENGFHSLAKMLNETTVVEDEREDE